MYKNKETQKEFLKKYNALPSVKEKKRIYMWNKRHPDKPPRQINDNIKEKFYLQKKYFKKKDNCCLWCGLQIGSVFCKCENENIMVEREDTHLKKNCVVCKKSLSEIKDIKLNRKEMLINYNLRGNYCTKCSNKTVDLKEVKEISKMLNRTSRFIFYGEY